MNSKKYLFLVCCLFIFSIMIGCTKDSPKPLKSFDKQFLEDGIMVQKILPAYLDLEIKQSRQALIGERATSCYDDMKPFVLRIAVSNSASESINIGDDLLNYDLDLPYLNIFNKENIKSITVIRKGIW